MINIKLDCDQITFKELFPAEELRKICFQELTVTVARITKAVTQGLDPDGNALRQYSPKYQREILAGRVVSRRGAGPRKVAINPVNHTISGDLLGSRQVLDINDGAQAAFVGSHYSDQSNAQLASYLENDLQRPFHDIADKDVQRIERRFDTELDTRLNQKIEVQKGR